MAHITRESITTRELRAGDDVIHPAKGRFTVQSIEDGGFFWTVTTTRGLTFKVSPHQAFGRYLAR